jgi:hypothetical protein
VQKINIYRVDYPCACSRRNTPTSAPLGFGKYSFPFRKLHSFRFPQALFQRISNGIYLFLRRVSPNRSNPLKGERKKKCLIWITTGGKPRITFSVYFFSWLKVISRLPECWLQISNVVLIFKIALVTTGGKMRITFFGLGGTAQKVISHFPSVGCK